MSRLRMFMQIHIFIEKDYTSETFIEICFVIRGFSKYIFYFEKCYVYLSLAYTELTYLAQV